MTQGYTTRVVSTIREIEFGENATDAFSRVRVSQPSTLFSVQCQYNSEPLIMGYGNTGDGDAPAFDSAKRMVLLSVNSGASGGLSWAQSFEYIPYQPGKSQLIFITGLMGTAVEYAVVRCGIGDNSNGIFYEQNGIGGLNFVITSSTSGTPIDNSVSQSYWNIDPLDGTGPSGIILDPTKVHILVIDCQYLGMGQVRMGFDINGKIIWAHHFHHANAITTPYMQTLALPVRMQINATSGLGTEKNAYFKCASVSSEGGFSEDYGYGFAAEATGTAGSSVRAHIGSIRPATTFNSLTNRIKLQLDSVDLIVTGANPVLFEMCLGVSYSVAPGFSAANATYSASEIGSGGTYDSLTGGVVIGSAYVAASTQVKNSVTRSVRSKYPLTLDRSGAVRSLGTLAVLGTGIGGTSACRVVFNWQEIR